MGALVSDLHVHNRHVGLVDLMVVGDFTCQISSLIRLTTKKTQCAQGELFNIKVIQLFISD